MITQEDFYQYVTEGYRNNLDTYIELMNRLNLMQRKYGFKEIDNINTRANNALVRSIQFFKKKKLNYWDQGEANYDKLFMNSCEVYICNEILEASKIIYDYVDEAHKIIENITNSPVEKIKRKYGNKYKFIGKPTEYKEALKSIQYMLDRFFVIEKELEEFDPERDLVKTYELFLPKLYKYELSKTNLVITDKEELRKLNFDMYFVKVFFMYKTLVLSERFDDLDTFARVHETIKAQHNNNEEIKVLIYKKEA